MAFPRREDEAQREDTVPDVSAPRSVETPSGVGKQAKPPAKRLVAGDVVAEKYVIERTLGMGGMGLVLAAKHIKLGTKVAIKVVHSELATDPQAVARFLREAQAMARLGSEHVVRVHDVGELPGGVPYMIMEYLEGKDLSALLVERGPLPITRALEYIRQACDALAEAHAAGIIHRDVKPQNLFLVRKASGAEMIRVLDFGLAKAVSTDQASHQLTQTGHVLGTAHYMAPEQLRAGASVDARTDVWALGSTLFRLLTRQYPFQESNAALAAAAILTRDPARIESIRADVPPQVAALVNRCLARDPAHRFQSVNELALAIDQARMSAGVGSVTSSQPFLAPRTSSQPFISAATPSRSFVPSTPSQSFVPAHPPAPSSAAAPGSGPRSAAPTSNAALYVSLVLLAFLVFSGGLGAFILMKKRPAPRVASTAASTAVPVPSSPPRPADPAPMPVAEQAPPAAAAPTASTTSAVSTAKPKAAGSKPVTPAPPGSGKTSLYDSL